MAMQVNDEAVTAAFEVLYGQQKLAGEQRAAVTRFVRRALEAAAPHMLSDPDAKKLGPFARESSTSRLAALAAYPNGNRNRRLVLEALRAASDLGLTRDEIAEALGMSPNTVRPRVAELQQGGWVTQATDDEDRELTRATPSGRAAAVLVLTQIGRKRLEQRDREAAEQ